MPQLPIYYENGIEWAGEKKGLLSVVGLSSLQVAQHRSSAGRKAAVRLEPQILVANARNSKFQC
jgi:hypothetical protein